MLPNQAYNPQKACHSASATTSEAHRGRSRRFHSRLTSALILHGDLTSLGPRGKRATRSRLQIGCSSHGPRMHSVNILVVDIGGAPPKILAPRHGAPPRSGLSSALQPQRPVGGGGTRYLGRPFDMVRLRYASLV